MKTVARSYCLCSQESCINTAPVFEASLSRAMKALAETEGSEPQYGKSEEPTTKSEPPASQPSPTESPEMQEAPVVQESGMMSQAFAYNKREPPASQQSTPENPETQAAQEMQGTGVMSQVFPVNTRMPETPIEQGPTSEQQDSTHWIVKAMNIDVVTTPKPDAAKVEEYRKVKAKIWKKLYNAKRDGMPESVADFAKEQLLPVLQSWIRQNKELR